MRSQLSGLLPAALLCLFPSLVQTQQIAIPRIELMPDLPAPYAMRNWKAVAAGYDSLVFDFNRSGTYLPLVWMNNSTVNYPGQQSFGLHTVVGTIAPLSAEAINCLPAVIGASLVGIDKTSQSGRNWVLMTQEWFNRRPAQNIYKNHPVDDTGDDWWYTSMPNIFFYQLYSLHPMVGDAENEFLTVAQRWRDAVGAMGGADTPWKIPNMDHRGWLFDTMTPFDAGVHEPEAAGATAWLLYHAYRVTHEDRFRIGAELSMEFLNARISNPSYELQLSYGALAAARMNAELGTNYDVQKILNWCFDVGPLRSWGAMVGTWGGNDCSGLIGEVNGANDYAFAMNTFEQVGALVPLVRYDDRFARAIGKWVLNAANAARLFYRAYLPATKQDSYSWGSQFDSSSVIAHEALRQFNGSTSPYATGDAIAGGWGATNLALYGSSHVGILGGIIDTTEVPGILRLDVMRTDYFGDDAYPTFLYYNPYGTAKDVSVEVGQGTRDIYDAVSNAVLLSGVTGQAVISIPANNAVLVSLVPSGGTVSYDLERMSIDGIVVDFRSAVVPVNHPPRVKSLASDMNTLLLSETSHIYCTASDRDNDSITYHWTSSSGLISGTGQEILWTAPGSEDSASIQCVVDDSHGGLDTSTVVVEVVAVINNPPTIGRIVAQPRKIPLTGSTNLTCLAGDPDSDSLSYLWTSEDGMVIGIGMYATWDAPAIAGNYFIRCMVDDGKGGTATDSISVEVRDLSILGSGSMIAYYPFNGNAADESGNGNNGSVSGAALVPDRNGVAGSAYAFNGTSASITVPNASVLNFTGAITVNFWMKVGALYTREQYPLSHGNWEHRWKVSLSNGLLRWTVKTNATTADLDSESPMVVDSLYNVTVRYDGSDMELYLNGGLDAFRLATGQILTTDIDLTIGQVLPGNQNYNFNGVLDDIRIYNYGLSLQEIADLYQGGTPVRNENSLPKNFSLDQNFPNPFNPSTTLRFSIPAERTRSPLDLSVYDVLGRKLETLFSGEISPGVYTVQWDATGRASGVYYCRLETSGGSYVTKMVLLR